MTTADVIEQPKDGTDLVAAFRAAAAPAVRERRFWVTLGIAFLAHALLLASIMRSPPQQIGDPNASPEAVAVSFVTEADLRDATTGAEGGAAVPAQQPTPQGQATPAPKPPEPQPSQPEAAAQPEQQAAAAQPPPPEQKAAQEKQEAAPPEAKDVAKADVETPTLRDSLPAEVTEQAAEKAQEKAQEKPMSEQPAAEKTQEDLTKENPDLLSLPDPMAPGPATKKQQQAKKPQKQAMRQPDMTLPGQKQNMMTSLDGRSAGIERPAGITRSGANDDFARGVIKALRQTMPQMNVLGRVTVRLLIGHNGNIESVEVVSRSENSDLNRAVVFSTKQASFPFPPNGATLADRTFTITYIYH